MAKGVQINFKCYGELAGILAWKRKEMGVSWAYDNRNNWLMKFYSSSGWRVTQWFQQLYVKVVTEIRCTMFIDLASAVLPQHPGENNYKRATASPALNEKPALHTHSIFRDFRGQGWAGRGYINFKDDQRLGTLLFIICQWTETLPTCNFI